jgi:hypothetical protein
MKEFREGSQAGLEGKQYRTVYVRLAVLDVLVFAQ